MLERLTDGHPVKEVRRPGAELPKEHSLMIANNDDRVQDAWDAYQDALSKSATANGKGA